MPWRCICRYTVGRETPSSRATALLGTLVVAAAAYLSYNYFENQWPLEHGFCLRKDCGHGAGRGVPEVGTNARPLDNAPDAGTGGNPSVYGLASKNRGWSSRNLNAQCQ